MKPIIDIADFSFAIGDTRILDSVSFAVERGEYVSIIGPNGAGKSTLLKCIMRIHRGGTGGIAIDGEDIAGLGQKRLARIISHVPQEDRVDIPFTVEEFVTMSRYPHMSPFTTVRPEDRSAVRNALEIAGCTSFSDRMLDTLSGGERRTVAIAAALAQSGRIMLLDEPTTFLDPKHEMEILSLIRRVNRDVGATILSVTHNINHAAVYSDRIGIMQHGTMVFFGRPEEMMNNDVLAPVYDRTFTFIPHPGTGFPVIIPEGYAE